MSAFDAGADDSRIQGSPVNTGCARSPSPNAERARRYRLKKKKTRDAQKAARDKAVLQPQYNGYGLKAPWQRSDDEFQTLPTWNHWEFNEALEGVATAEEIRDIAEGISLKGGFIEFNPEGRQAFRDAHVASKAEQARRRAEHNAWQAAKDAEALKNPPCCPYFVDDEKLAELLGDDLTHPDHPLHRQQLGSWDTELPDEEEDLESDSWDHDSKN